MAVMKTKKRMGELLLEAGLVTPSQLDNALLLQKGKNKRLGKILIELGYITENQVAQTLSHQLSLPLIDCQKVDPSKEVLALVPKETAEKKIVFPVEIRDRKLVLAMANPLDWQAVDELSFSTGFNIAVGVAAESSITDAIENHYAVSDDILKFVKEVSINEKVEFLRQVAPEEMRGGEPETCITIAHDVSEDAPIIKFVTMVLVDAAKSRASDIHIEPGEKEVQIRYRVDGELKKMLKYPIHLHDSVVTRIKIISDLDITNRRLPQDGRTLLRIESKDIDIRISTLPSVFGEKLVLRLLDHSTGLVPLAKLGIPETILKSILTMISMPQGMVLVTGPTGSGKTTTLYSLIQQLQSETKNIITIEDPVEYRVTGTTQVGINEAIGLSFSNVLRSVLRQDPDIILVGEIRDLDTAEIATRAALTGHLVLSTLHTNDTVATITRLIDVGLESYLIASSITGVIAQRLVRRICPKCKFSMDVSDEIKEMGLPRLDKVYKGKGCADCQFTGYFGRVGVYELLTLNLDLKRIIAKGTEESMIREAAQKAGLVTLFADAWAKVAEGITTVDEVLTKIPFSRTPEPEKGHEDVLKAVLIGLLQEDVRIAGDVLKQEGFEVNTATTRESAEKFLVQSPDLMVVYANDGLAEFMDAIRKDVRLTTVPVVILADVVSEALMAMASRWRVQGLLARPVRSESFLSSIQEALKA